MTSKNHSERSIKKKMYELNLLQRPVKKLKTWTEDQDEDLTELYNLHKHDDEVMRPIMAVLGNLRSRQNVIGALLRLGLIANKDEVRKKSKSRKSQSGQDDCDEDSEDESDSDEESGGPKEEDAPPPFGSAVARLHGELTRSKYILGGLKWLITVMNDNLEDLDADAFDSDVPMLPLLEEAVLSMGNPAFQDFLHAIGFKKPVQHQEVYWRVSSTWKETDFRTRIDVFDFLIENRERSLEQLASDLNQKLSAVFGEEVDVLRTNSPVLNDDVVPGSSTKANTQKVTKITKEYSKKRTSKKKSYARKQEERASDESDFESAQDGDASSSHWSLRKRFSSDSEEVNPKSPPGSSNVPAGRPINSQTNGTSQSQNSEDEDDPGIDNLRARAGRNSNRIRDDSDDEVDQVSHKRKFPASDDSGSEEHHNKKKRNVIDSDEEMVEEFPVGLSNGSGHGTSSKKRNMIASDDEIDSQAALGSRSLTNNTPGSFVDKSGKKSSSSKKKRRIIESDDDMDILCSEISKRQPNVRIDSDNEMVDHEPIDRLGPANGEHGNSEISPAVESRIKTSATRKMSRMVGSDDEMDADNQVTVRSESSGKYSPSSVVAGAVTPHKAAKKKRRVIDSDDEEGSQASAASTSPAIQTKAAKKLLQKNVVDSDEDIDSQSSAVSKPSAHRPKVAKKARALVSDDEIETKASENESEADNSDDSAINSQVYESSANQSKTVEKKSKTIDSDEEIDIIASKSSIHQAKAGKNSKAVDSDANLDCSLPRQ